MLTKLYGNNFDHRICLGHVCVLSVHTESGESNQIRQTTFSQSPDFIMRRAMRVTNDENLTMSCTASPADFDISEVTISWYTKLAQVGLPEKQLYDGVQDCSSDGNQSCSKLVVPCPRSTGRIHLEYFCKIEVSHVNSTCREVKNMSFNFVIDEGKCESELHV